MPNLQSIQQPLLLDSLTTESNLRPLQFQLRFLLPGAIPQIPLGALLAVPLPQQPAVNLGRAFGLVFRCPVSEGLARLVGRVLQVFVL